MRGRCRSAAAGRRRTRGGSARPGAARGRPARAAPRSAPRDAFGVPPRRWMSSASPRMAPRVKRGERVLEDHRHLAPDPPHLARPSVEHLLALEAHLAGGGLDEAQDRPAQGEPSVSVPTAIGVRPALTPTVDPLEEPHGERSRTCGLRHCRPRPLQPLAERVERKFAHSLRLVLPSSSMPAARSRATNGASAGAGAPTSASDPAVVSIRSPVSMLSLTRTGMP